MDKTAIKSYAIEARRKIIEAVKRKAATSNKELSPVKVEEIACTWFNRLIALRIMEVNDWLPSNIRILSSREEGRLEPEAIREIDRLDFVDKELVAKLILDTDMNAADRLYRHVLIEQCKALASILPGLFKAVDSDNAYEFLPDSLITKDGIVYDLITKIEESNFDLTQQGQIEIIGWLYQFYISEKKDEVFAGLKKNVKINKDTIPAATQLFTPEWIVKYMVENSLGRLWLESPSVINDETKQANLKTNWKYYVEEAEQEPEVAEQLKAMRAESPIKTPEDIKFIDPCMGSGHILVYAFEVMYQIYASEGYAERDIPNLILEKNLHGLDIDDRACQLAYFALMMKARSKNRRFFRPRDGANPPQPMVYSAKGDSELEEFGSLMKFDEPRKKADEVSDNDEGLMEASANPNTWNFKRLLAQKYDVVVTNPPYMAPAPKQADWIKKHYPNSKSDLCVVFIERNFDLMAKNGYLSMITMHSWMFLSSYEKFRAELIANKDIVNMAHLGARAFEEIGGEVVQTTSFVVQNTNIINFKGRFARLVDEIGQNAKEASFTKDGVWHDATQDNFKQIPSVPIAYWVSEKNFAAFEGAKISESSISKCGMGTSNNNLFLRLWFEVAQKDIGFDYESIEQTKDRKYRWFPYNKGGSFRKWYGNKDYVVNFYNNGFDIREATKDAPGGRVVSSEFYFRKHLSWSDITTGSLAFRSYEEGFIFDASANIALVSDNRYNFMLGYLNTKIVNEWAKILNPTFHFKIGNFQQLPYRETDLETVAKLVECNIQVSETDWDSFETSWDFKRHPLLKVGKDLWWNESDLTPKRHRIEDSFNFWSYDAEDRFNTLKANEEELNRIFIDIYGLQDELTPEVEDKDVTVRKADKGRDIRSFISYAVGCMFGRYSLDEEGLAFAGGTFAPSNYKAFAPVDNNIIPIGVKDYFDSDVVVRFTDFVRTVYGEMSLSENLAYIAEALYPDSNGTAEEKLRRYFLSDFYKDHLKIYQKRPIYWLLDSGKKNGFKALIYLHRYTKHTMGIARTDYLHTQLRRYESEIESLNQQARDASDTRQKATYQKQATTLQAALDEASNYDQIIAYIAHQQIDLDLDDGVKANYAKFQAIDVPKNDGGVEKMDLLGRI